MSILIIGNVIKDIYLGLDPRGEHIEQDAHHTDWLDLSFNASKHHFFNRTSSFGGAAVSLEVLVRLGLDATVSDSDFAFTDEGAKKPTPATIYRYVLTTESGACYFTPTHATSAPFTPPAQVPSYLYIDRSATLGTATVERIQAYLEAHPEVELVLYHKPAASKTDPLAPLLARAGLIFTEGQSSTIDNVTASQNPKTVLLTPDSLTCSSITEPLSVDRIDTLTHLSAYSIAAATILGCFVLGKSVENSLRLAKLNLEHSTLSRTLTLEELASIPTTTSILELTAASLVLPGKGILAADESGGSVHKKFEQLQIPDDFPHRHSYRDIFFSTPDIEQYLSGIILFDETARDHATTGETYPKFLLSHRIIPGIKVDQGLEPLGPTLSNGITETSTKGLDGLPARLTEYYDLGLRFAKWRAAFQLTLDEHGHILTPTDAAITENCRILAKYATMCQAAGIVPIVEPEVVYDGYYSIGKCAFVTARILDQLFATLTSVGANLRACLLKCNMVLAGKQFPTQSTPDAVGHATAEVLRGHVPADLAGIVFLSGGQTPEQATANLAAVLRNGPFPWPITFSFARALQDPALYAWRGLDTNVPAASAAFMAQLQQTARALK